MPRLNTLRGFTRSGLWSSFSWLGNGPYPPCGSVISFEVTTPCLPPGRAVSERVGDRGEHSIAGQADRHLLIGCQSQRGAGVRHTAHHQAAVVAIGQSDPLGVLRPLVAEITVDWNT